MRRIITLIYGFAVSSALTAIAVVFSERILDAYGPNALHIIVGVGMIAMLAFALCMVFLPTDQL